jgi:signal transduction histidine kinase
MYSARFDRLRDALSFRLAAWYLAIFVVSSLAIVALTYALLAASLHERDHDAVRQLLVRYGSAYARGGIGAVERTVTADRQAGRYEPFFLRLARGRNAVVYLTAPGDWRALDTADLDAPELASGGWVELSLGPDQPSLDVSGLQLPDGTRMQVGKSSHLRAETLARFRAAAATILIVVLAAALAGGVVLTHSALAPLRALTATIQQILQTGRIETRVPARRGTGPLDTVARLFNDLLGRLQRLIDGMRQTLDNTAHDLRTPLTRARSRLEAALSGPPDAGAYARAMEDTLEDIDRIGAMLTTLMDISEAQTGAMRLERTQVSVAALVEETMDLYADVAEARGIAIDASAAPDLHIDADRSRARQVLANVVDNAVKYTPAGGCVRVTAAEREGLVEIAVADSGIGIPPDELPQIWDRLFRGDRSRSERGLGLGLSLVKAIVERHGGRVGVESRPGEGSRFTVELPTERPPRIPASAGLPP